MKSKNCPLKDQKTTKRKQRKRKKRRRKSKKAKKDRFAKVVTNYVNNKYQVMVPKSFNNYDLRKSMQAGIFDMTDDPSKNRKTRQIMYCLVNFIYRNAFKNIIMPNERMASYGISKNTVSNLLKYFQDIGFLNKIFQGNSYSELASEFRVNIYFLKRAYTLENGVYPNFESASRGRKIYPEGQTAEIYDPKVKEYVLSNHYYFHKESAFEYLCSEVPIDKRQDRWSRIKKMNEGEQTSYWHTSEKNGRIYCNTPCTENLPKIFRLPHIISYDSKVLYNIDYSAQFFNMYTWLTQKKLFPHIWADVTHKTGLEKAIIKDIVNPAIIKQTRYQYILLKKNENMYIETITEHNYDLVMNTLLQDYGITFKKLDYDFYMLGSALFFGILMKMSDVGIKLILPLHDGIIIQGSEEDAQLTKSIFQNISYDYLDVKLPVDVKRMVYEDPLEIECEVNSSIGKHVHV